MQNSTSAIRLLILMLVCTSLVHSQKPCRPSLPSEPSAEMRKRGPSNLLLVADNQEHNLTGVQLRSMGVLSDRFVTSVAMRTPLAHVGGRLLLREVLRFGAERNADLVLHLGDASNISCPKELASVFDLLDNEAKNKWFMTPGNHDGILLGTFVRFQPGINYHKAADYGRRLKAGLGHNKHGWYNACQTPSQLVPEALMNLDVKGILTRGDAINLYVESLKKRGADVQIIRSEDAFIADTNVACTLKKITFDQFGYTAVARICNKTPVTSDPEKWVGPFASYIVQKLEIGGTTIILLDTSDYADPTVYNVGIKGGNLTEKQLAHTAEWLRGLDRKNVIIGGHHPLDDLPKKQQQWVIEKAARYISGHVHRSTQLINHQINQERTLELNIGSTIDPPSQAVIAEISGPKSMSFEVIGDESGSLGFLQKCQTKWQLESSVYKNYRRGTYVNQLLNSLTAAAAKHLSVIGPLEPGFEIPSGKYPEDWRLLETALTRINEAKGESGTFWACQAYFASKETKSESLLEWLQRGIGRGTKRGCDAAGRRFAFSPP